MGNHIWKDLNYSKQLPGKCVLTVFHFSPMCHVLLFSPSLLLLQFCSLTGLMSTVCLVGCLPLPSCGLWTWCVTKLLTRVCTTASMFLSVCIFCVCVCVSPFPPSGRRMADDYCGNDSLKKIYISCTLLAPILLAHQYHNAHIHQCTDNQVTATPLTEEVTANPKKNQSRVMISSSLRPNQPMSRRRNGRRRVLRHQHHHLPLATVVVIPKRPIRPHPSPRTRRDDTKIRHRQDRPWTHRQRLHRIRLRRRALHHLSRRNHTLKTSTMKISGMLNGGCPVSQILLRIWCPNARHEKKKQEI